MEAKVQASNKERVSVGNDLKLPDDDGEILKSQERGRRLKSQL